MREKTYHIYLNEEERSRVIQSLIALKNNLAASLLAQPLIRQSNYRKYFLIHLWRYALWYISL